MKARRPALVLAFCLNPLLSLSPATAQMDTTTQAQGMVLMGQNQGYIDRARARADTPPAAASEMATICTDYLPVYRKQYGDDHPKMQKMKAMCRRLGY
ncbi:MAG: hypothetical protein PGN16_17210 [Sphingomonas phyllosphaerae]|uniref:hypothetical protein n=1 Tax=Sphingomonas phyllosphaerae TaxID=257003 RepID=UPI002FF7872B